MARTGAEGRARSGGIAFLRWSQRAGFLVGSAVLRHRQRIIKPVSPRQPEKAQITIPEADDLYREVRVENVVTDESGEKAGLKPGAVVDVIVKADSSATMKKN